MFPNINLLVAFLCKPLNFNGLLRIGQYVEDIEEYIKFIRDFIKDPKFISKKELFERMTPEQKRDNKGLYSKFEKLMIDVKDFQEGKLGRIEEGEEGLTQEQKEKKQETALKKLEHDLIEFVHKVEKPEKIKHLKKMKKEYEISGDYENNLLHIQEIIKMFIKDHYISSYGNLMHRSLIALSNDIDNLQQEVELEESIDPDIKGNINTSLKELDSIVRKISLMAIFNPGSALNSEELLKKEESVENLMNDFFEKFTNVEKKIEDSIKDEKSKSKFKKDFGSIVTASKEFDNYLFNQKMFIDLYKRISQQTWALSLASEKVLYVPYEKARGEMSQTLEDLSSRVLAELSASCGQKGGETWATRGPTGFVGKGCFKKLQSQFNNKTKNRLSKSTIDQAEKAIKDTLRSLSWEEFKKGLPLFEEEKRRRRPEGIRVTPISQMIEEGKSLSDIFSENKLLKNEVQQKVMNEMEAKAGILIYDRLRNHLEEKYNKDADERTRNLYGNSEEAKKLNAEANAILKEFYRDTIDRLYSILKDPEKYILMLTNNLKKFISEDDKKNLWDEYKKRSTKELIKYLGSKANLSKSAEFYNKSKELASKAEKAGLDLKKNAMGGPWKWGMEDADKGEKTIRNWLANMIEEFEKDFVSFVTEHIADKDLNNLVLKEQGSEADEQRQMFYDKMRKVERKETAIPNENDYSSALRSIPKMISKMDRLLIEYAPTDPRVYNVKKQFIDANGNLQTKEGETKTSPEAMQSIRKIVSYPSGKEKLETILNGKFKISFNDKTGLVTIERAEKKASESLFTPFEKFIFAKIILNAKKEENDKLKFEDEDETFVDPESAVREVMKIKNAKYLNVVDKLVFVLSGN